jgi:hypothetical protein
MTNRLLNFCTLFEVADNYAVDCCGGEFLQGRAASLGTAMCCQALVCSAIETYEALS